jgi:HSP20 family protein
MSSRSNPFEEMERFFDRLTRQFDEASSKWESEGPFSRWTGEFESPAVDLVEQDDSFVVTVDLPGFERDEIKIRVTDQTLRIEAEHEEAATEEDERYIRRERRHETTRRAVRLPDEVDKENVHARMKNGVLTVTLPKLEVEESRTIEIE